MKFLPFLSVLFISLMFSCGDAKKDASTSATPEPAATSTESAPTFNVTSAPDGSGLNTAPVTAQTPPQAKPAEPAQNADGVWHYTCPKGCKGGGGAAGPCASCGATLAHNSAYHGNPAANTAQPPVQITNQPPLGSNAAAAAGAQLQQQAGKPAEPAQNAKGVWHFTCPNGCEGGGGAVGPCGKCGGTLAHNQAYHQ